LQIGFSNIKQSKIQEVKHMRKTLQDVASYLKEIMVPETREAYGIDPVYTKVSSEEHIRKGVLAFRAFLVRLYDGLYAKGPVYDHSKKAAHEYENRTTLSVYYPFLHHVSTLLMNIGYHGKPIENAQALTCGSSILDEKLSVTKTLECLRFLADCGICIDGIDINEKSKTCQTSKP
jgi:hypothetical protein